MKKTAPTNRRSSLLAASLVTLVVLSLAQRAAAATLTVTSLADNGPGSLRQAIADAGPGDLIDFAVSGKIKLAQGTLTLSTNLTIQGPGADKLIVSANGAGRVIEVLSGNVAIKDLTIAEGSGDGAGLANAGVVRIERCVFREHQGYWGGGIYNAGDLTVISSLFTGNLANSGAGIRNEMTAIIVGCSFVTNSAVVGGGIYNGLGSTVQLTVRECLFRGNESTGDWLAGGGGISNGGKFLIQNSTFSGNDALQTGGAIYNHSGGTGSILHSTITQNSALNGGGIGARGAPIRFGNTVVAGNRLRGSGGSGPDCAGGTGQLVSDDFNLLENTDGWWPSGSTNHNLYGLDPKLGSISDNGGPTLTHALLPGSPAIDRGNSSGLTTDQRGLPRPVDFGTIANADGGDGSDIGAFELASPDSDGDGLPDDYEELHNLNWNDPTDAAMDADQDGQSNLDEFRVGTDPQNPTSVLRLTDVQPSGADLVVRFESVAGKQYRLEGADELNPQAWTTVADNVLGTGAPVAIVDAGSAGKSTRFYRLSLR